jgi:hypothetical protein
MSGERKIDVCQQTLAIVAAFAADRNVSEGQHIGIRPAAGMRVMLPGMCAFELLFHIGPAVPEIIRDAPHLRIGCQSFIFGDGRGPGRKTQHDGPAAFA